MRKSIVVLSVVALALISGMAMAAPSYLGMSGNILTPNDSVLKTGDFSANYVGIALDDTAVSLGASFGLAQDIEVGLDRFDPGDDSSAHTLINAKYRLLSETAGAPGVSIGVVDASGDASGNGNPSFYVVAGKNLTPVATSLSGAPVMPLRGYIGFGSGIYDSSVFLAAEWAFTPRASIVAEYVNKLDLGNSLHDDSVFNAELRLKVSDAVQARVGVFNGEDLSYGISFEKAAF